MSLSDVNRPQLHLPTIHTGSPECVGPALQAQGITLWTSLGSSTWYANNLAVYMPMQIWTPVLAKLLWVMNGAAASGNVDMGIYDERGTRLVSIGSTAQAGTNAIQTFDITDTLLLPGLYYLALALSSTVGTVFDCSTINAAHAKEMGMFEQTAAFALPATATFATYTRAAIPLFGLHRKTLL